MVFMTNGKEIPVSRLRKKDFLCAQMLTGFYFYIRFFNKKIKPVYYLLFAVLGITGTDLIVYVLLLSVSGFFVCQIRNTSIILYAVMIAEIMQFMFGIVHSILCLVYPLARAFDQEMVGMTFMVFGYLPLPAMAVCCYAAGKFFSYDEAEIS